MSWLADLKMLYHLALAPVHGASHADRLQRFYEGQAARYDASRRGMLHGRRELFQSIPIPSNGTWIDLGGGTGANLEYLGASIHRLKRIEIVDLTSALLEVARQRISERGWPHVHLIQADATRYWPSGELADVVTCSYSLTMIPDWFAAIDQAFALLKPGGLIGVVDFYVSRKYPARNQQVHSWLTRTVWPIWFGLDNVYLTGDQIAYLHRRFEVIHFSEHRGSMRYLPFARIPYYRLVGRKPE